MGQRREWQSTPDTLPKPGPVPEFLLKSQPQGLCSLTQCLHLLQRVISTNDHHHSCGLPAPACPPVSPGPHSPCPHPAPFPFLEQLCIIPSPLTSPFPNTPTCPFWFCASSWSALSAKSNRRGWHWPARVSRLSVQPRPWPGLSLSWSKAGQGLCTEVVRCQRFWCSVFLPLPPDILFISLHSTPISLLCCFFFVLFCFISSSLKKAHDPF